MYKSTCLCFEHFERVTLLQYLLPGSVEVFSYGDLFGVFMIR